ncbi:restriction endonuclease [Janibacter anophelis]|uniref:restriction endonuclease n=1 Tax=Janibacter anophelis TaxID=319054 RepID=UPI0012ED0747|nr:restriction endonuclease [Janibacter anophelis]
MQIEIRDFNGSAEYFGTTGHQRWAEIADVLDNLTPQLQASDQAGKIGRPIFDPKGTNARLTVAADAAGWRKAPVPGDLRPFGKDWDAGKGAVLAEWQFSNYPFLWNNIIRSEAIFQSKAVVAPLTAPAEALIIVTKSGSFPASNSTLYFEQANAQIDTVTTLGVFEIPIRLVGLMVPKTSPMEAAWNVYAGRYAREAQTTIRQFDITWMKSTQYGNQAAAIHPR